MTKRKTNEGTKFLRFFGPLLDALRKLGGSGTPDEVVGQIATDLNLSDEVQNELLPSGGPRYRNQVAWARFYLVRAGLLDSSKRGVWSLTERGRTTQLTVDEAGEIFSKWVKIFDAQRRAKTATDEPIAEQVAEGSGAMRTFPTWAPERRPGERSTFSTPSSARTGSATSIGTDGGVIATAAPRSGVVL